MKRASKTRRSAAGMKVDANVRCKRVYPVQDTKKKLKGLETVAFKLDPEQAIHLARVLLCVTQKSNEANEIEVTARRFQKRKDGTYRITVTWLSNRP